MEESIESDAELRWASWSSSGARALLAGNHGTLISYQDDNFERIPTPTQENLRCVDFSPDGNLALLVGNNGTLLEFAVEVRKVETGVRSNLRRASWKPDGSYALLIGNEGAAYRMSGRTLERIDGAENNLRSISWHPKGDYAIITGNCFRPSLSGQVPASNLYKYSDGETSLLLLQPLQESRADLVSASWKPDGSSCIAIGSDSVWQTSVLYSYDGRAITKIPWDESGVYPTCFVWHPSGEYGLIGTAGLGKNEGIGMMMKFERGHLTLLLKSERLRVSCVAWNPAGTKALIVGSPYVKAFSA